MTVHSREVATQALLTLGVLGVGEEMSAPDYGQARTALAAEIQRASIEHGFGWGFGVDDIPERLSLALSDLLAARLAPAYSVPGPSAARAIARLRALSFPNDLRVNS